MSIKIRVGHTVSFISWWLASLFWGWSPTNRVNVSCGRQEKENITSNTWLQSDFLNSYSFCLIVLQKKHRNEVRSFQDSNVRVGWTSSGTTFVIQQSLVWYKSATRIVANVQILHYDEMISTLDEMISPNVEIISLWKADGFVEIHYHGYIST